MAIRKLESLLENRKSFKNIKIPTSESREKFLGNTILQSVSVCLNSNDNNSNTEGRIKFITVLKYLYFYE